MAWVFLPRPRRSTAAAEADPRRRAGAEHHRHHAAAVAAGTGNRPATAALVQEVVVQPQPSQRQRWLREWANSPKYHPPLPGRDPPSVTGGDRPVEAHDAPLM